MASHFISGTGNSNLRLQPPRDFYGDIETAKGAPILIPIPTDEEANALGPGRKDLFPSGFKTEGSYNWVLGKTPETSKIIVPGYPPCWSPPNQGSGWSVQLLRDEGFTFIDQNCYRSPEFPMEPMFRALLDLKPDYDIKDFDIVTDRNNFMKLFSFLRYGFSTSKKGRDQDHQGQGRGQGKGNGWREPSSLTARHLPWNPNRERRDDFRSSHSNWVLPSGAFTTPPSNRNSRGAHAGLGYSPGRKPCGYYASKSSCRIDVDLIGDRGASTMAMARWDARSVEYTSPEKAWGFGLEFLTNFTEFDDAYVDGEGKSKREKVSSHYRMVSYEFGGQRFLVRYHADVCNESVEEFREWKERNKTAHSDSGKKRGGKKKSGNAVKKEDGSKDSGKKNADDDLKNSPNRMRLRTAEQKPPKESAIEVLNIGIPVFPNSTIASVKTCKASKSPDITWMLGQAFFSQTPFIKIGYHSEGLFGEVQEIEAKEKFPEWIADNEIVLKKLILLLKRIREAVQQVEGRRATIVFDMGKGENGIKVFARTGQSLLPNDLLQKWD